MTTHEIARVLSSLAKALRSAPDQTLKDLSLGAVRRSPADGNSIPAALSALVALSTFSKSQWAQFIKEQGFPIEIRASYSSRDLVGKLLNYLEKNAAARKKLASAVERDRSKASPELLRALQLLLTE